MNNKTIISLNTKIKNTKKITITFLITINTTKTKQPTLIFQTKKTIQLTLNNITINITYNNYPSLPNLITHYQTTNSNYLIYPIYFNTKHLNTNQLIKNTKLNNTMQL